MCFDWQEYFSFAKFLQKHSSGGDGYSPEAVRRSAVSRAYYAAFCYARMYACSKGFTSVKSSDHSALPSYFSSIGLNQLAENLEDLRGWRNQCDYEPKIGDIKKMVNSAIVKARQIITDCS
jgi:uncharacterized protein (UPF0332 family)